ncbi:MAG: hypothetical protein JNJ47_06305, partial [Alphaproteobacteria bacterium]|nr:hypothetical protein [Alphaproteobacteria bacterium]
MSSKIILMFIYSLINRGIKIWIQDKDIKLFVPDRVSFTDEEKKFITLNKEKIFNCLKRNQVYSKEYDYLLLRDDSNRGILSFAQERLWFVDRYEEGTSAYNIPIIFKILDHVNPIILERSIRDIVERHE